MGYQSQSIAGGLNYTAYNYSIQLACFVEMTKKAPHKYQVPCESPSNEQFPATFLEKPMHLDIDDHPTKLIPPIALGEWCPMIAAAILE